MTGPKKQRLIDPIVTRVNTFTSKHLVANDGHLSRLMLLMSLRRAVLRMLLVYLPNNLEAFIFRKLYACDSDGITTGRRGMSVLFVHLCRRPMKGLYSRFASFVNY